MPEVVKKPLSWFKPDLSQPRKVFDIEELRLLASTLKVNQLVPCLAKPDGDTGTIVDGERRWRAAMLENKPETLDVILVTEDLTPLQQQEMQLITLQRTGLSDYEQFVAYTRWFEMGGGTAKALAQRVGRDPAIITRIMSLSSGVEPVKKAAAEGKLTASGWYPICRLEPEAQLGLLSLHLNGKVSRNQLQQHARKARNGTGNGKPEDKVAKVRCELPGDICVVVSGKGVSLDESIEALGEAIKAMKKARDEGYTAKTFAAAMKDRAKK